MPGIRHGTGSSTPLPTESRTFQFDANAADGSVFQVDLAISGFIGGWTSFNPQPDPPGDIGFAFVGDSGASLQSFQISDNADLRLSLSAVPEPGSLALRGFGAIGVMPWLRRATSAAGRRASAST